MDSLLEPFALDCNTNWPQTAANQGWAAPVDVPSTCLACRQLDGPIRIAVHSEGGILRKGRPLDTCRGSDRLERNALNVAQRDYRIDRPQPVCQQSSNSGRYYPRE